MNILHLLNLYKPKAPIEGDIFAAGNTFSIYKKFWKYTRQQKKQGEKVNILHIHSVDSETFGIYALLARICGVRVLLHMHNPSVFSYVYIVKRLLFRFCINHTICVSKYELGLVDKYHLAKQSKRSLIYQGVDYVQEKDMLSKELARSFIYKNIGISFTKNIRMIGTIVRGDDVDNGLEHFIDAMYLAEMYKNLTNTVFVVLVEGVVSEEIKNQIHDLGIESICFIVENVIEATQYIKAFDMYISARSRAGDIYTLLSALYARVSCIATKVGDSREFAEFAVVPLVPPGSAKFLTEAMMYVIQEQKPIVFKAGVKMKHFPKKFTLEMEKKMVGDVMGRVAQG